MTALGVTRITALKPAQAWRNLMFTDETLINEAYGVLAGSKHRLSLENEPGPIAPAGGSSIPSC